MSGNDEKKDKDKKPQGRNKKGTKSLSSADIEKMCAGMRVMNSLLNNSQEGLPQRRFNPNIPNMAPVLPESRDRDDQGVPFEDDNSHSESDGAENVPNQTPPPPFPPPPPPGPDEVPNDEEQGNPFDDEAEGSNSGDFSEVDSSDEESRPQWDGEELINQLHYRIRVAISDLERIDQQLEQNRQQRIIRERDLYALLIAADEAYAYHAKELELRRLKMEAAIPKEAPPEKGSNRGEDEGDDNASSRSSDSVQIEEPTPPPIDLSENEARSLRNRHGPQNPNGHGPESIQVRPANFDANAEHRRHIPSNRDGIDNFLGLSSHGGLPIPGWVSARLGIPADLYTMFQSYPVPTSSGAHAGTGSGAFQQHGSYQQYQGPYNSTSTSRSYAVVWPYWPYQMSSSYVYAPMPRFVGPFYPAGYYMSANNRPLTVSELAQQSGQPGPYFGAEHQQNQQQQHQSHFQRGNSNPNDGNSSKKRKYHQVEVIIRKKANTSRTEVRMQNPGSSGHAQGQESALPRPLPVRAWRDPRALNGTLPGPYAQAAPARPLPPRAPNSTRSYVQYPYRAEALGRPAADDDWNPVDQNNGHYEGRGQRMGPSYDDERPHRLRVVPPAVHSRRPNEAPIPAAMARMPHVNQVNVSVNATQRQRLDDEVIVMQQFGPTRYAAVNTNGGGEVLDQGATSQQAPRRPGFGEHHNRPRNGQYPPCSCRCCMGDCSCNPNRNNQNM